MKTKPMKDCGCREVISDRLTLPNLGVIPLFYLVVNKAVPASQYKLSRKGNPSVSALINRVSVIMVVYRTSIRVSGLGVDGR